MRLAFQSARGAPGTTTLALATAVELSSRQAEVLLVEADPAGGVLTAELDLPAAPTVVEFSTDARMVQPDVFRANAVHALSGELHLLTAPSSSLQTTAAWSAGAERFARLAPALAGHLVLDLGRGTSAGAPHTLDLLAERTVHVVRPELPDLAALIATLREHDSESSMRVLLVVDRPRGAPASVVNPREVREVLAPYGAVIEVPWDAAAAMQVRTAPLRRRWARTPFGTVITRLVDRLLTDLPSVTHTTPADTPLDLTMASVSP